MWLCPFSTLVKTLFHPIQYHLGKCSKNFIYKVYLLQKMLCINQDIRSFYIV